MSMRTPKPSNPSQAHAFQSPPSLRESVYTHLKYQITRNHILPGAILFVDRLAAEFRVSRTPVREALLMLEGDKLVDHLPHHGFMVTSIDARDIENVYTVRTILESHAAFEAAVRITDPTLAELTELFLSAEQQMRDGIYDLYLEADLALHQRILDACDNPILSQLAQSLSERSLRIRFLADSNSADHARITMDEHQAILAALKQNDQHRAQLEMTVHLQAACARTLDTLHALDMARHARVNQTRDI